MDTYLTKAVTSLRDLSELFATNTKEDNVYKHMSFLCRILHKVLDGVYPSATQLIIGFGRVRDSGANEYGFVLDMVYQGRHYEIAMQAASELLTILEQDSIEQFNEVLLCSTAQMLAGIYKQIDAQDEGMSQEESFRKSLDDVLSQLLEKLTTETLEDTDAE